MTAKARDPPAHRLLVDLLQDRCLARLGSGARFVALTSAARRHLGRRCDYRRRRSAPLQPARQAGHAGPARRRGDGNCRRRGRPRVRRDYPARPETGGQVADYFAPPAAA